MSGASLRVLSVASELYPLVKTGGLADVAGALPAALAAQGIAVRSLVPGYPAVMRGLEHPEIVHRYDGFFGGTARLLAGRHGALDLYVLDAPHLYDRLGNIYVGGWDWTDNARRFAALSRAAADIGQGLLPDFLPDVVHAHDWQAGLVPAYLHFDGRRQPATVITVHNLAFQGQFPASLLASLQLPPASFTVDGVEYYGDIGFLKAGLRLADRITTVSPSYAAEIATAERGMGLDGLLRARAADVVGILNGLDLEAWNPTTDATIAASFDAEHIGRRMANKAALQQRLGLALDPAVPLFGVVSRLTWQKGMDLLLDALPGLLAAGAQFAMLGSGDGALEAGFQAASTADPARIGVVIGYDESLAHLVQAGSDALLVPSRFEPCGLTQLSALRYGCLPVVARVGGLADTVIDANEAALAAGVATGIQFSPVTADALAAAIRRTVALWRNPLAWQAVQANAMHADVGWSRAAAQYAALYRGILAQRQPAGEHA